MSDDRNRMKDKGKNFLIVALIIVAAVQAGLLFSKSRSDFMEKGPAAYATNETAPDNQTEPAVTLSAHDVAVIDAILDRARGSFALVAFNRPVVDSSAVGKKLTPEPGIFKPAIEGEWVWVSPFMLRFDAKDTFDSSKPYTLTLDPQNIVAAGESFTGPTDFTLKMQDFETEDISLNTAPVRGAPGSVQIRGSVEFTLDVDPEEFLKHAWLDDPSSENGTVPIVMERYYQSSEVYFASDPEHPIVKTAEPRELTLVVDESLPAAGTKFTLGETARKSITIVLDPNLTVRGTDARSSQQGGSITLSLSTSVDADTAQQYIHVGPEAQYSLSLDGNDLVLSGDFAAGHTYTVQLDKGLPALDGAKLPEAKSLKVRIPDLEPSVAFDDTGVFLAKSGLKNIAFTSVNAADADFKVDRIYRNNILYLLHDYSTGMLLNDGYYSGELSSYLGDRVLQKELKLDAPRNTPQKFVLSTDEYFPDEPGLYRVLLSLPGQWHASQRFVLVTDLGMVAKRGVDDMLVWVASYKDLSVKPGVTVRLVSYQNQTMAEGKTDENGVVHFTDMAKTFQDNTPYIITAELGDDMSFLVFNEFGIDTTGQNVGGVSPTAAGYMGYVYGERDIYRPGETVEGVAVLRQADLATPPSMPLTLKWVDPRGRELAKLSLTMNEQGMAPYSFDVPAYALTGHHTLQLEVAEEIVATYDFQVEEFMPDRIKVDIASEKGAPLPGKEFTYTVESRYFFGPPASGLPVETQVRLLPAPFAPKGFDGYVFGDSDKSFEDMDLSSNDGVLDGNGTAAFTFTVPEGLTPPAALAAQITARVSERGGRGVASMQQITAHAYPRYPGIKRPNRYGYDPGRDVNFDYVVVAPDGTKVAGQDLTAELYLDRWQTVLRRTPSGSFHYQSVRDSQLVSTKTVGSAEEGAFTFAPPQAGSYRVVLRDGSGASSQLNIYAGGWGYSPWAVENPANIELVPDKKEYAPGDTASVQVRAPFSGKLLVTVEGRRVYHVASYPMDSNTAQVSFPIKEEYGPNVYVTAVLVRPAEATAPGKAGRAFGSAPIFVNREVNNAPVAIDAPEVIRPETTLDVTVQADAGAMVTLSAVDEGILQLIDQESPDPFPYFYAKRQLEVSSYDTFAMLLPEVEGRAPAGGGEGSRLSKYVRTESLRRVKPVAFWFGPVQADAEGKATFHMDIPEFQGALRLMAVTVKGKRFGAADAQTRVKSPVVLTPTLPRFMAIGDTAKVPVAVRNDTPEDGVFSVSFNVSGPGEVNASTMDIEIPQGQERLAVFTLNATEEGIIQASFTAKGNGETSKANVELPVRPALPPKTVIQSGALSEPSIELPTPEADTFRSQGMYREVYLSTSPIVRYTGSLKYLLGYPYGCVEQTTSRVFPLLYIGPLAAELDPDLDTRGVPYMVQAGIERLYSMQVDDGGFSFWPGGREAYAFGSFYATHFLVEAWHAGYRDHENEINRALDYVTDRVREYLDKDDAELDRIAYGLYILALVDRPDKGSMDHIRSRYGNKLSPAAGALLGAAYAMTGDTNALEKLMEGRWEGKKGETGRETGGFLRSPLRDTALRLAVLQLQLPGDRRIGELVQDLVRMMDAKRYISTQEAAWALVSLGRFYKAQAEKPPFSGRLLADGKEVRRFSSDTTLRLSGEHAIQGAKKLEIMMDEGYEPGSLFYTVRTVGTPTEQSYAPYVNGLKVARTFYNRTGDTIDLKDVKQGDLVALKLSISSQSGPVDNVAVVNMLPAGLEVENPRLTTTERLPWLDKKPDAAAHHDMRDDRVIFFVDLGNKKTRTVYALLRAVTSGEFKLPPVLAEAMYDPQLAASTELGAMSVISELPVGEAAAGAASGNATTLEVSAISGEQDNATAGTSTANATSSEQSEPGSTQE
ncbi:alpha-2-macroglobulin family protein [Oceanidesulfovibrio marinus]|uniref:Alpha-2-macroglobulin family protein n=1 Tax=Oceanidesulfovibrio marinus TaxID=370038 RepID=A0ABX6NE97_9BACT|nr:MG2 domain-containing protein [Oceanidesulfovibrio marinus]QJT08127.1 alpha-2-macroglobulin family protein [Oceanidesulfovibrio marinus]